MRAVGLMEEFALGAVVVVVAAKENTEALCFTCGLIIRYTTYEYNND
jgi:hypothetical protein